MFSFVSPVASESSMCNEPDGGLDERELFVIFFGSEVWVTGECVVEMKSVKLTMDVTSKD